MNDIKIRNHFVPKLYLKNWSNRKGKILTYDSLVSHENVPTWEEGSIKYSAYEKHLYTSIQSGIECDEIETWFDQEFESPVEPIIKKLIHESKVCHGEMLQLVKFLALQDVRTPKRLFEALERHKKHVNDLLPKILGNVSQRLSKKNRKISIKENDEKFLPIKVIKEIKDGAESGILRVETIVGRKPWLFSIKHSLEKTVKTLLKHHWIILRPYDGMNWLTSDNPVIKLNYSNPLNYDLKGGWGRKKGNIFFPIGPKHALFTQIGARKIDFNTINDPYKTLEFNEMQIKNSYRYIYSVSADPMVEKFKPRVVNKKLYDKEKDMWEKWHQENSKLENEFDN